MSWKTLAARDEVLYMNIGYLGLTGLSLPVAMTVLYASCLHDVFLPPLIVWLLSVVSVTALLIRKPFYPFRVLGAEIPAILLTAGQRRVLAFCRGREASHLAMKVAGAMTGVILLTAVAAWWLPLPEYLPRFLRPTGQAHTGWRYVQASVEHGMIVSLLNACAVLTAHVGAVCWYTLRHWERIQAAYPPWPVTNIRRDFLYLRKESPSPTVAQQLEASRVPEQPLRNPMTAPLPLRDGARLVCYLVGGVFVLIGVQDALDAILRLGDHPLGAIVRASVVPGFGGVLLLIGWWLRR
jgi:hypothetical protein